MDISKIFLEEKLFENGFSELIISADEAQGAKLPLHISLQSEVSLDKAFPDGTRLSELSHFRQSSHPTLYTETIKDSHTQKSHSKTVGVESCYNEDNFEIKLIPKFTSNSPSNSESSTATEDRTASLPIIVIVRVKNEFILNVNGVVSPQEHLEDSDIAALLEIYRCGAAQWCSVETFSIGSNIGSGRLEGLGKRFGVYRFPKEPIDNYLLRASMFILTSPELASPAMAPETTWTLWAKACFESPMHFLLYIYTHTTYYYSWFNIDGDLIQPNKRADWELIARNYQRRALLYYDTKFSTADIDMMFTERDEVIRHLKMQNMVIQRQFNDHYTPGLHKALECVRDYARIRPLTLDERVVRILALAGVHRGQFNFVLLQLSRQATLKILIHAEFTGTAPKHTITPEMSSSNFTSESDAPELASSIANQLEHLARPLLLTNTVTNAPIFTELIVVNVTAG